MQDPIEIVVRGEIRTDLDIQEFVEILVNIQRFRNGRDRPKRSSPDEFNSAVEDLKDQA